MNKDQIKGAAKDVAGKVQREIGAATGSPGHEARGMAKQVEGKMQKKVGDAKEVLRDADEPRDPAKP
jgi:uncharacterized protein YjbJ (UPF0337 family)